MLVFCREGRAEKYRKLFLAIFMEPGMRSVLIYLAWLFPSFQEFFPDGAAVGFHIRCLWKYSLSAFMQSQKGGRRLGM